MTEISTGGCFCRAVRYELRASPLFTHCCHCLDCQCQTGGAFAINALIEASNLPLTQGELERTTLPTESGRPHDVYRCPACKTALWSDYGRRGYIVFLRVSTLDKPHEIVPDVHIFTRSKVPWVRLPEGVRAFEEFYDMKKEWPAEAMQRREAASAAAKKG